MRVLAIVDDTPDIRRMVRVLLERAGAEVQDEASSITEVLAIVEPESRGVVILDHHLEGDVLGLDGAALVKARAPHVKVVLFSALDLDAEAEASPAIDAFVRKDRLLDLPRLVANLETAPSSNQGAGGPTVAADELAARRALIAPDDLLLARWLSTPALLFGVLPPPVESGDVVEQLVRPTAARSDVLLDFVAASGEVDVAVAHLLVLRELIETQTDLSVDVDVRVLDLLIVEVTSNVIAAARRAAMVDPLTGLGNRRALEAELASAIARCERSRQHLTVVYFDLVGLKAINDRQGHEAGDRALTLFARSVELAKRASDFTYRVGGDEFVAVLPDTDEPGADRFAHRLTQLGSPSFSYGAANTAADGFDARRLVRLADVRMLQARYQRGPRSESPVSLLGADELVVAEDHT